MWTFKKNFKGTKVDFFTNFAVYFQKYFLQDQKLVFLWKSSHGPNGLHKLKF